METIFPALTHDQQHMKNIDLELVSGGVSTCPFSTTVSQMFDAGRSDPGQKSLGVCGGC